MTKALCLFCGAFKIGALSPCIACGSDATGNNEVDILFSDNLMASATMNHFSTVIGGINQATTDAGLRINTFLIYVSDNHPNLFHYELEPTLTASARTLLATLSLPLFEILPGIRNTEHPDKSSGKRETKNESPQNGGRPWWQFWKRGP